NSYKPPDLLQWLSVSCSRMNSASSCCCSLLNVSPSSSSGLPSQVLPSDCLRRQRRISSALPLSSTSGTPCPAASSGRVQCGQSSHPSANESSTAESACPSTPGSSQATASRSTMAPSAPPDNT